MFKNWMSSWGSLLSLTLCGALCASSALAAEELAKRHAISEFGTPRYPADMTHWPYVNPDAPKGGKIGLGAFGTFDSLNPYLLKGNWPRSIGHITDTLMTSSGDELLTVY